MTKYRVVTNGELALGFRQDEVRRNLAELCKYDRDKLTVVLSGAPFTFKTDLDEGTAQRYKAALDRTGIVCTVEEAVPEIQIALDSVDALATSHHPVIAHVEKMTCPKCGELQPKAVSCASCGVAVAKLHPLGSVQRRAAPQEAGAGRRVHADDAPPRSGRRWLVWMFLALLVAGAGFYGYRFLLH